MVEVSLNLNEVLELWKCKKIKPKPKQPQPPPPKNSPKPPNKQTTPQENRQKATLWYLKFIKLCMQKP